MPRYEKSAILLRHDLLVNSQNAWHIAWPCPCPSWYAITVKVSPVSCVDKCAIRLACMHLMALLHAHHSLLYPGTSFGFREEAQALHSTMQRIFNPPGSTIWDLAQAGRIFEASIKACEVLVDWYS